MSGTSAHSIVDSGRTLRWVTGGIVIFYALITMLTVVWILVPSFKRPPESIPYPP